MYLKLVGGNISTIDPSKIANSIDLNISIELIDREFVEI